MTLDESENLSKLIVLIREKNNISQRRLGHLIGVEGTTVRDWEIGKSTPKAENLRELAKFARMSLDRLDYFLKYGVEPDDDPAQQITRRLRTLTLEEVAEIAKEAMDLLAAAAINGNNLKLRESQFDLTV